MIHKFLGRLNGWTGRGMRAIVTGAALALFGLAGISAMPSPAQGQRWEITYYRVTLVYRGWVVGSYTTRDYGQALNVYRSWYSYYGRYGYQVNLARTY